jgi:hypothetical protein
LLVGCASAPEDDAVGQTRAAIVYGNDDRLEVYEHPDSALRERVRESVVALIAPRLLHRPPSGAISVATRTLEETYFLCAGERFGDQPAAADCSGTLIDDDLVLTAGHCFEDDDDCASFAYVFDYFYRAEGELEPLSSNDVYACRDIVVRQVSAGSAAQQIDFAIVQLDRPVGAPRVPVRIRQSIAELGEPVSALGFTSGVPAKIDTGGKVIDTRTATGDYFLLDSDTFSGSSGSGLFDRDGALLGLLVRGGEDYFEDLDRGCFVTRTVPAGADGTPWEQATYAHRALQALCDKRWPSPALCGIEPACGDGFCTLNEVSGSCPEDCGMGSCANPPCAKSNDLPLEDMNDDLAPETDAGSSNDGEPKQASSGGCSARMESRHADAWTSAWWLALALFGLRKPRRRTGA